MCTINTASKVLLTVLLATSTALPASAELFNPKGAAEPRPMANAPMPRPTPILGPSKALGIRPLPLPANPGVATLPGVITPSKPPEIVPLPLPGTMPPITTLPIGIDPAKPRPRPKPWPWPKPEVVPIPIPFPVPSPVMVPVPAPSPEDEPAPGGEVSSGDIRGCWTADRELYGPYRLTFCVGGWAGDSYMVTGNGLDCQARLAWRPTVGGYSFAMRRSRCGWGTAWTGDRFTCVMRSGGWDGEQRVAVPSQGGSRLDCYYMPAAWGYPPTTFSAYRA